MVARLGFWALVVEVASLFAEPLNVGFGLLARWENLLTNLGDVFVLTRRLYVNDETLLIGRTIHQLARAGSGRPSRRVPININPYT